MDTLSKSWCLSARPISNERIDPQTELLNRRSREIGVDFRSESLRNGTFRELYTLEFPPRMEAEARDLLAQLERLDILAARRSDAAFEYLGSNC